MVYTFSAWQNFIEEQKKCSCSEQDIQQMGKISIANEVDPEQKKKPMKEDQKLPEDVTTSDYKYSVWVDADGKKRTRRSPKRVMRTNDGEGPLDDEDPVNEEVSIDRISAYADLMGETFSSIKELNNAELEEATYKGREVPLNKPMKGDIKKSKVYVDPDGDGKAQKVEFGDPNMSIKKNNPARKKSYCARSSGQGNLNNKASANYWSRKAWDC